jgi:hypothetical protein
LELPKARLAGTLPSRPVDELPSDRDHDDDDVDDEGMWDRKYAKMQSSKSIRSRQKKAARHSKADIGLTL